MMNVEGGQRPDDRLGLLIHDYDMFVGLFKTYCDLVIKLVTWFFAISGAILTYYLKNVRTDPHLIFVLPLLGVFSLLLALFFRSGATKADEMTTSVGLLRKELDLDPNRGPHVDILATGLRGASAVLFAVAFVLLSFMAFEWREHWPVHP